MRTVVGDMNMKAFYAQILQLDPILWRAVFSLLVVGAALVFQKVFGKLVVRTLMRFARKTSNRYDDGLLAALEKPLRWFLVGLGLYLAVLIFYEPQPRWLGQALHTFIIIVVAHALFQVTPLFLHLGGHLRVQFDRIVAPFLTRVIRFFIVALAVMMVAQEWGFQVSSFLAGLGLGGLALALAAKDSLANLFAGFVIITERPFSIGDWIKTPSVEGTVEDITFRSTKVRTFAQALVTVPNSLLAGEPITNWARMGKRQVSFHLGLSYRTPRKKLEQCVKEIRALLHEHPETHNETILVNFDQFGASSLDIFVYYFTTTTVWSEYLQVKEEINLKIMEILERHGVEIAFPSQSVYFETPLQMKLPDPEESSSTPSPDVSSTSVDPSEAESTEERRTPLRG
ncbi:MAG: mechanosensitive ion channel family protein [Kyrpidia sp.]|nr:mechanosensitive ion channel family protein [Kyrpidia sp.]